MSHHSGRFVYTGRISDADARAVVAHTRRGAVSGVTRYADERVLMAASASPWVHATRAVASSGDGTVVAWAGRLDNRDDLLLRLSDTLVPTAHDAAVAAAAFERWGVDGLALLNGEWTAAVWESRRRTLHLARDYMAVRTLYYAVDPCGVRWSTRLSDLVECPTRSSVPSEEFAARFMALRFSCTVTPYTSVEGVPAGSCTSFRADGSITSQRIARLRPASIRYRDVRQYEQQLREIWRQAVACRLATVDPVWAELSGGFDSSAVVCMASSLVSAGGVAATSLRPISYVTLASRDGDERRYIEAVERRTGLRSEVLGVEEHASRRDPTLDRLTPFATHGVGLAGAARMRAAGGRVLLSGRAGDVVMGCEPDNSVAVLDDVADGRVISAAAKLRRWSRATRKPFVELLWQLRGASRTGLRTALARRAVGTSRNGVALLTAPLRALVHDEGDTIAADACDFAPSKRAMAAQLLADADAGQLAIPEAVDGLVHSYPYTHRPLVEFMLAIPGDQLSAPGEIRSLMRRAFDGLLPNAVLGRISKGYYPPSSARAVRSAVLDLGPAASLEVVRRGWVDVDRLAAAMREVVDGPGTSGREVQRVLRLEAWLQSRLRRAPAAIPQGEEVTTNEVHDS